MKAVFALLLLCSVAHAEPKYIPKLIPHCVKQDIWGSRGCCYSLDGVKALYHVDADCVAAKAELKKRKEQVLALSDVAVFRKNQLNLALSSNKLLSRRMAELTKKLIDTDKKLQEERVKPRWGTWISWGIAATVSAAFVGYVVADNT